MHDQTGQTYRPARRPGQSVAARRRHAAGTRAAAPVESLEGRTLFAIAAPVLLAGVEPNVNVSRLLENQHSPSVAVNPTNPANVFIAAVQDSRFTGPLDDRDLDGDEEPDPLPLFEEFDSDEPGTPSTTRGIFGALSFDAGRTYGLGDLAVGGVAPSTAFDEFGNLFLAYYNRQVREINPPSGIFIDESTVELLVSIDSGQNFSSLASFPVGSGFTFFETVAVTSTFSPQPSLATGAGSVWLCFELEDQIVAAGARVLGLGATAVEDFTSLQPAFRSEGGRFADIAVGPAGEVLVSYQIQRIDPDEDLEEDDNFGLIGGTILNPDGTFNFQGGNPTGPADIYVNLDPDGVGPEVFGRRFRATATKVGLFDPVNAQFDRTIDAEVGLAWDRSGGPFNGRLWMIYTDEDVNERGRGDNTDIFLRFSDDNGQTWSSPRNVVDEDFTNATQFLPRIALDQTNGNLAVSWHDTRDQNGLSNGDNDETTYWLTVGTPTTDEAGIALADNIRVSDGISDAPRARNVLEFGEYSGLAFNDNVVYPAWADNSNSTGDNPSGGVENGLNLATFDLYSSRVFVTAPAATPPEQAPVGPGSPLTPQFLGRDTINRGKAYRFQVRYTSEAGVDVASLGDDDLLVTGPNGYNLFADFLKAKRARRGTVVTGTYQAFAPGGQFDTGDNGLYSILVQGGAVRDLANTTTAGGLLDQFLVSSTLPAQSPPLQAAPPASAALSAASDGDDDDNLSAVGL